VKSSSSSTVYTTPDRTVEMGSTSEYDRGITEYQHEKDCMQTVRVLRRADTRSWVVVLGDEDARVC